MFGGADSASNASTAEEDEDEEMMGMIKRISVMETRKSMLNSGPIQGLQGRQSQVPQMPQGRQSQIPQMLQGRQSQMQVLRGSLAVPKQNAMAASPNRPSIFETLGAIDEEDDDEDMFFESAARSSLRSPDQEVTRDVASELRRQADKGDANVDRYGRLIQRGICIVSEVKSALYDADDAARDVGSEVLLDEVKDMLSDVTRTTLGEAAQLQKTSESWLKVRKKMARQLKINHNALELSIERRAETARESNAENRKDCDRLWRQIQDWEREIENMPKKTARAGSTLDGDDLLGLLSDNISVASAPDEGGLTLEGAHSLLRAFNAVLRPHMSEIIPQRAELRSSSEAIALEFLNACNESMKQESEVAAESETSPPPLDATMRRCNSSPDVIHGDKVESAKPDGLLPLEVVKDTTRRAGHGISGPGTAFEEEQRMLFSKVGQSY